jgi:hypothetical protein
MGRINETNQEQTMAVYFFGLNDDPPPADQVGEELVGADEAHKMAGVIAQEIGRNDPSGSRIGVFDSTGNRIAEARYGLHGVL